MKLSNERQEFLVITFSFIWCTLFLLYSIFVYADGLAVALFWNLFLAALPLFFGAAFQLFAKRKKWIYAAHFFVLWLLFLPNAPYILTDLIHLKTRPESQLWLQLVILLSCAGAGALFGYVSLLHVQFVIERQWGKTVGWLVAGGALMLCGFGIYIGRFLRWNSWNMLFNPLQLLRDTLPYFMNPAPHPHPVTVTFICGFGLLLGYLAMRVFTTSTNS